MAEVKIICTESGTEIWVNGAFVSKGCISYSLCQKGGEPAELTLQFWCRSVEIQGSANIQIKAETVQ